MGFHQQRGISTRRPSHLFGSHEYQLLLQSQPLCKFKASTKSTSLEAVSYPLVQIYSKKTNNALFQVLSVLPTTMSRRPIFAASLHETLRQREGGFRGRQLARRDESYGHQVGAHRRHELRSLCYQRKSNFHGLGCQSQLSTRGTDRLLGKTSTFPIQSILMISRMIRVISATQASSQSLAK